MKIARSGKKEGILRQEKGWIDEVGQLQFSELVYNSHIKAHMCFVILYCMRNAPGC